MKRFKPGQQVVFRLDHLRLGFDPRPFVEKNGFHWPKENEVCTIAGESVKLSGRWFLKEYLNAPNQGMFLAFSDMCLFPVEEICVSLTEKITSDIEKSFELIENKS